MGYVRRMRQRKFVSKNNNCQSSSQNEQERNVVIKLVCENPGCLDINLEIPLSREVSNDFEFEKEADCIEREINVEDVMNELNLSIIEHNSFKEEQQVMRPCKESDINVQVITSDAGEGDPFSIMMDEDEVTDASDKGDKHGKKSILYFFQVNCTNCYFNDLAPINI